MTARDRVQPTLMFVHNGLSSFVRMDLACLRDVFNVEECYLHKPFVNPFRVWGQVKRTDLVFGWFASWHTFLPVLAAKLLGKRSLIVTGGYDVANLPEAGYGHQRGGLKSSFSSWILRNADCILPFSQYSADEIVKNAHVAAKKQQVSYLGIQDQFGSTPQKAGEPIVLTVGNVDKGNLFRKGHEPFVRAAALHPGIRFVLAGRWKDNAIKHLKKIASPNVTFTGWISENELLDLYKKAVIYVQVSLHEGFGMSVAEAMLAGCVPVVTRRGSLPEVVGNDGVYVASNSPEDVAGAIGKVLALGADRRREIGCLCRHRILDMFPVSKRSQQLRRLVFEIIENGHSVLSQR